MIKIVCIANKNVDDFKNESWPCTLSARPMIGDLIESKSGKILKIWRITHKTNFSMGEVSFDYFKKIFISPQEPYLEIELINNY